MWTRRVSDLRQDDLLAVTTTTKWIHHQQQQQQQQHANTWTTKNKEGSKIQQGLNPFISIYAE